MEGQPIRKSTALLANRPIGEDVKCSGGHTHCQLRGHGPGGLCTAQAAMYPQAMCELILELVTGTSHGAPAGGSHNHNTTMTPYPPFPKMVWDVQRKLQQLSAKADQRLLAPHRGAVVEHGTPAVCCERHRCRTNRGSAINSGGIAINIVAYGDYHQAASHITVL